MSQASHHNVYLASSNEGKLRELQAMVPGGELAAKLLPGFSSLPQASENHDSFALNAIEKALHYSRHTEELVCADDSGLVVDALNGAPGVRSARYAGENATDANNNRKLLEELKDISEDGRSAHYICVLALARKGELVALFSDRCEGRITDEPRGEGGFGYDPYFFFPPLGKTLAEVSDEEKNKASHRGKAFRKLITFLEKN